jgi:hypothetical protein
MFVLGKVRLYLDMIFASHFERHWLGSETLLPSAGFEVIITVGFKQARRRPADPFTVTIVRV